MSNEPKYQRVLLKLSGEGLMGQQEFGLEPSTVARICKEVKSVHDQGVQVSLVIGAGNIFRGVSGAELGIERTSADYMGMLATVINAIAVQSALEGMGVNTRVLSAIPMSTVCEPYIRRRASRHLEKGRIVILAAGTGSPYVTTDTAAAQRAMELEADILLKATRVDGVYSEDPEKNPHAVFYPELDFQTVIEQGLRVMDSTAISHCMENKMPVLVFNYKSDGNIVRAVQGEKLGTRIS